MPQYGAAQPLLDAMRTAPQRIMQIPSTMMHNGEEMIRNLLGMSAPLQQHPQQQDPGAALSQQMNQQSVDRARQSHVDPRAIAKPDVTQMRAPLKGK